MGWGDMILRGRLALWSENREGGLDDSCSLAVPSLHRAGNRLREGWEALRALGQVLGTQLHTPHFSPRGTHPLFPTPTPCT